MGKFFLLIFLLSYSTLIYSQTNDCGITVDAGEDIILCEPGGSVDFQGKITGDYLDFEWLGNVDSPNSLSTSAYVTSTTSFILESRVEVWNLIPNHDFESGNVNFSSGYRYETPAGDQTLWDEGTYTVSDNPNSVHRHFPACDDHTPTGSGLFMQINGNKNSGVQVWCQDVVVNSNRDFLFSAWAVSFSSNTPDLQFTINGNIIGDIFDVPKGNCTWYQFNTSWNSGNNTNAEICITNLYTAESGNDFGIDDIFFGEICKVRDTITVEVLDQPRKAINTSLCEGDQLEINGESIDSPGEYGPFYLSSSTGCDTILTVTIEDVIILDPIISEPLEITCENLNVTLSAENSVYPSGSVEFRWSTSDGNIVSGQGTSEIIVDKAGRYSLTLIYDDGDIYCESEVTFVDVHENVDSPDVDIYAEQEDCNVDIWDLFVTTDIRSAEYEWSTNNGVLSSVSGSSVQAFQAGTYYVKVIDLTNGCYSTDTIIIEEESISFEIIGSDTLDCDNDTLMLYADNSELQYEWTTDTGQIISDAKNDTIFITSAGRYFVIASLGDCAVEDTIDIHDFTALPTLDVGPDITLNCNTDSAVIFSIVNSDIPYHVKWRTIGGNIIGSTNNEKINLDSEGIYIIEVTTLGGCTARDSVIVHKQVEKPKIEISRVDTLNCRNRTAIIDARNSDKGDNFLFQWTVVNGGEIISDKDSLYIEVDSAGSYQLEIINQTNGCRSYEIVSIIEQLDTPTVDAGRDTTLMCGDTIIEIRGNILDPSSSDSLYWTTQGGSIVSGDSTLSVVIEASGFYIINVMNVKTGCVATDTMEVFKDNNSPYIDLIDRDTLNCNVNEITLSAENSDTGAHFIPHWTTVNGNILSGQDSYVITVNAPGSYSFSLTNSDNNCESIHKVIIVEDTIKPQFTHTNNGILNCEILQDTINISLGNPGDEVSWEVINNGNILSTLPDGSCIFNRAGTYKVTITNPQNGCVSEQEFSVVEKLNLPTITAENDTLNCLVDRITISPYIESNESYDVLWSTINGNILTSPNLAEIDVNQPGTYIIKVTSAESRCVATDTVEIIELKQLPTLVAGKDKVITCDSMSVRIALKEWIPDSSDNEWFDIDGTLLGRNISFLDVSQPGTYIVRAFNPQSHCEKLDTIIVTDNLTIPEVSIDSDGKKIGCSIENLTLTAVSDNIQTSFLWTNSIGTQLGNNQAITIDTADVYTVIATNPKNGCTDSVHITIEPIEEIAFELGISQPDCINPEGTISISNVTGGLSKYSYFINGQGIENPNSFIVSPGNYLLRVEDEYGCTTEEEIIIEAPEEVNISYVPEHSIVIGDSASLVLQEVLDSNTYTFSWMPPINLDCDTCVAPNAFPTETTTYYVDVKNEDGCTTTLQVVVYVDKRAKFYIPNAISPNRDGINDVFRPYIWRGIDSIDQMRIYDRWGSLVYLQNDLEINNEEQGWNGMHKGKLCTANVYVYKIALTTSEGKRLNVSGEVTIVR